jgi:crotonobetainyl-CoA:carnitine CoA-transferase CaiB-like acyl-CoA transferase
LPRLILDCSTLLPGPFLGKLVAQRGMRVLKIENPDRPDGAREMGAYYEDLNSMKELVWLNLTKPGDQARFRELVAQADGVIEGFRPAAKKKLGLDEETLHALNSRLTILSLVGYPEDGPWRDRAGHDMNFQAVTGCLSLFEQLPALPLADLFAAYEGALSLVAALDECTRTGRGKRVVVSMSGALENMQSIWVREYRRTGQIPRYGETLMTGRFPCYRLYEAGDGRRVTVGAIEHKFWEKFLAVIGLSGQGLETKAYATGTEGAATGARISTALRAKPWAHWAPLFDAADCCVEPVRDYSELYGL